jgi:hypothetical protein
MMAARLAGPRIPAGGFHLTFSSGLAHTVLVVEAVAVILLGIAALLMLGPARSAA